MTSQTIFLKNVPLETPRPKYYVYYDEWSGDITNIFSKLPQTDTNIIKDPYIVTDSSIAVDLIKGKINPKKYIVADLADGMTLVKKDDVIRINKLENRLTLIKSVSLNISSDINLVFYKSNWLLEINLNQDIIFNLLGKRFNRKFGADDNINRSKIVIYITEKNNPLILSDTIIVEPIELFNNGYVLIDLKHLRTKTTPLDLSFFTRRIFKNYQIKYKEYYENVDYHSRKSQKRKYIKIKNSLLDKTTFSIIPTDEGWIIKSNFDHPHDQKLFRDLKIFLFDDTPFGLLDKIIIPYDRIGKYQEYLAKTSVDPTKCYMMLGEENKKLSFKFEEIEYVETGKY